MFYKSNTSAWSRAVIIVTLVCTMITARTCFIYLFLVWYAVGRFQSYLVARRRMSTTRIALNIMEASLESQPLRHT